MNCLQTYYQPVDKQLALFFCNKNPHLPDSFAGGRRLAQMQPEFFKVAAEFDCGHCESTSDADIYYREMRIVVHESDAI